MRKVLVVEDEPLIRLAAIDVLEDAGFVVIEAANADVAMDIIAAETIQFLFTDIQMPGHLSGVNLHIKSINASRTLVLSSYRVG